MTSRLWSMWTAMACSAPSPSRRRRKPRSRAWSRRVSSASSASCPPLVMAASTAWRMMGMSRVRNSLWAPRTMAAWNSQSAWVRSSPARMHRSTSPPLARMSRSSSSVARWQASRATGGSKMLRSSKRSRSRTRTWSRVPRPKGSRASRPWATKVPFPRRTSSTPWAARVRMASRRVARLTPSSWDQSSSLGSFSPGAKRCSATMAL